MKKKILHSLPGTIACFLLVTLCFGRDPRWGLSGAVVVFVLSMIIIKVD